MVLNKHFRNILAKNYAMGGNNNPKRMEDVVNLLNTMGVKHHEMYDGKDGEIAFAHASG